MMSEVLIDEKKQAAVHYETLFASGKVWYTCKEAATLLGMSPQFIRDAFQSQELMGQEINSSGRDGSRRYKLIHRDCLLVYLMQTANYTPLDFLKTYKSMLLKRPVGEQRAIRAWLNDLFDLGNPRKKMGFGLASRN